jgi:predicted O-methyltransferase YrrM
MTFHKIKKALKAVTKIAANPWLLNHVLGDDAIWKEYLLKNYKRCELPTIDITQLFPSFHEELPCFTFLDGGSSPMDLALLRSLCKTYPNCAYFEIGTWRGESIVNVANQCGRCYTLDLPHDKTDKNFEQYGILSKNLPNVTHLYGDSRTFDYKGFGEQFDVVFIDGDHHFEFVKNDTSKVIQHLIRKDSTVVWHDYGYDPVNVRYEVLAGILDCLPKEFHNNLYHVSNTMCAVYLGRPSNTKEISAENTKGFKVHIVSV